MKQAKDCVCPPESSDLCLRQSLYLKDFDAQARFIAQEAEVLEILEASPQN